jgi:hypothetical protein
MDGGARHGVFSRVSRLVSLLFGLDGAVRCCVAQWLGQFSGHTHATKVQDAEDALRHAVAAFRAAGSNDRRRKAKAVQNLAERLLSARLKLLKARLAKLEPAAEGREVNRGGIEALQARETRTRAEGVGGLLAEFGALEVLG